eukprot:6940713-Alexandrium_andersonii.AAC.1
MASLMVTRPTRSKDMAASSSSNSLAQSTWLANFFTFVSAMPCLFLRPVQVAWRAAPSTSASVFLKWAATASKSDWSAKFSFQDL